MNQAGIGTVRLSIYLFILYLFYLVFYIYLFILYSYMIVLPLRNIQMGKDLIRTNRMSEASEACFLCFHNQFSLSLSLSLCLCLSHSCSRSLSLSLSEKGKTYYSHSYVGSVNNIDDMGNKWSRLLLFLWLLHLFIYTQISQALIFSVCFCCKWYWNRFYGTK